MPLREYSPAFSRTVPPTGMRFIAAAMVLSGAFSVPAAASSPRDASTQTAPATESEPPLLA